MNLTSRTITGILMIAIGLVLLVIPLIISVNALIAFWIYGLPLFIIGLFILFNKKEDEIEQIKSAGGKKHG